MGKCVDENYIRNYLKQQTKIIDRLKEIAQLMYCYDASEEYQHHPYHVDWEEELIHCHEDSVTLELKCRVPYEDDMYEEEYNIPFSYLVASDSDIIESGAKEYINRSAKQKEDMIKRLKEDAKRLGYGIISLNGG